jgi:predicted dienelactone hydrolase
LALAAGELRAACRRIANRTNKGAVCGSSRVACGRFDADARTPVSCKPWPAARCVDGRLDASACTAETHCADVVQWTAGTCLDPRDAGAFAAGVRVVTFTKLSEVDPSRTRSLDTVVWYPAPAGAGPVDPGLGGVRDAPLDASAGPYPLLLFSHGACGYPAQSTFLTALLATRGFVVAAPPHPGNTLAEFPTCGTLAALLASAEERPADVIHVTDGLLAADLDPGSPFYGAIDETRVGMSGHSFGGFTTFLVQPFDTRFRVAVPLAPATPGGAALTVPSLVVLGRIDSVVDNEAARAAFARGTAPRYLVEIENTGHFAFSNGCFPGPDCAPPATLTQDEAHAAVLRWVVPFLEAHLAGDARFVPFLAPPTPAGVALTAVP